MAIALVLPLAIGVLALLPVGVAMKIPDFLGDLPTWVQAVGVPAAIFMAYSIARRDRQIDAERAAEQRLAYLQFGIRLAEDTLGAFDEAERLAARGGGTRISPERFTLLCSSIDRFPLDRMDDPNAAFALHRLRLSIELYAARYDALITKRPVKDLREKLDASMEEARTALAELREAEVAVLKLAPSAKAI